MIFMSDITHWTSLSMERHQTGFLTLNRIWAARIGGGQQESVSRQKFGTYRIVLKIINNEV